LRLASSFAGPLNFVAGANYLHYQTLENYYVFSNAMTLASEQYNGAFRPDAAHLPFDPVLANACDAEPADPETLSHYFLGLGCLHIDPNPIGQLDGQGHNYFRSQNPYRLSSWALFGELYYQLTSDVKLTGGLRYTDDKKTFDVIPSWTLVAEKGYPVTDVIRQEWREMTGRANVNWTPKLDFTDQTLIYASYAHGYKGGGANPPGVITIKSNNAAGYVTSPSNETHPPTFKPEFNNAFELGTKNTLLDGGLTLNAAVFYYKYKNYQISQIVDRTSVNLNFDATVKGAEIETSWSPLPGLKFGFNGGYENATIDDGQSAIDLMDRTAGHTDWMVVKPYITQTSNCIFPTYVINAKKNFAQACLSAYGNGNDPVTSHPYEPDPNPTRFPGYIGFDPSTAPNNGEGFAKDLGGNQLPSAPHFTTSLMADYSMPISADWAGTLHGDFYWHSDSFARVFNDRPYDELRGYTNLNFALIFTNQDGWQAMAYVKNVLDTTAITGAFLNSDDSALTTNIFVTDPRLFGIRLTKNW
jgi:outer membrane receptor protein involved in Fe transport